MKLAEYISCDGLGLADLVKRFRQAGLRAIGRVSTPEFGYCPTTAPSTPSCNSSANWNGPPPGR